MKSNVPKPKSVRSRFAPEARAGLVLGDRDRELLADLYLHGVMSRGQLQELYFGSVPRCNQRLRQLYDFHFVHRHYLPGVPCAAPYGVQAIYSIGKAAIPIVAIELEVETAEVTKGYRRSITPTFLEHTLQIVNVRLDFLRATSGNLPISVDRWLPEMLCRHEYEIRRKDGGAWIKEVFKPDAFICLVDSSGKRHSYFIEVDLGHTSARQFLGKLRTHQRYLESGLFRETFGGEVFKTLVITTSSSRQQNLLRLIEEQDSQLFWFSTFSALKEHNVLDTIWQVPLQKNLVGLTPAI